MKYDFHLIDDIMFKISSNWPIARISEATGVSRPTITRLKARDGRNYEHWLENKASMDLYRHNMRGMETPDPRSSDYDPHVYNSAEEEK